MSNDQLQQPPILKQSTIEKHKVEPTNYSELKRVKMDTAKSKVEQQLEAGKDLYEACHWALAFGKNGEVHDKMIIEKLKAAIDKYKSINSNQ